MPVPSPTTSLEYWRLLVPELLRFVWQGFDFRGLRFRFSGSGFGDSWGRGHGEWSGRREVVGKGLELAITI